MIRMTFFLLGKAKEPFILKGYEEYLKRLSRFGRAEVKYQDEISPKNETSEEIKRCLDEEGKKALNQIKADDCVFLIDLHGEEMDSLSFSKKINQAVQQGKSSLLFIVGSSNGLSDVLRKRADYKICLSQLTTTHPLALLFTMEQVYRGFMIGAGSAYHK